MSDNLGDLAEEIEAAVLAACNCRFHDAHHYERSCRDIGVAVIAALASKLRAGKHVQENGAWKIGFSYGEKVASDWQKLYDDAGERIAELEACIDTLITVDEPSRYYDNARVLLKPDTEAKS